MRRLEPTPGSRGRVARGGDAAKAMRNLYASDEISDAPEHHEYARAMGLLTWGTWDTGVRPFEERLKDFLQAYPAEAPERFQGAMLAKARGDEYGPAASGDRLARVSGIDNSFGTLPEVLARHGLRRQTGPQYVPRETVVAPFREITRVRNQRLRGLHGRVDIEADNMDAAKAAELDRLEKQHAAEQIRAAREQMRQEVSDDK